MDEIRDLAEHARERFESAVARCASERCESIGTQKEQLLHRTLKYFLEPDASYHEIPLDGYIADIYRPQNNEIIEIQTVGFDKLRSKLRAFLPNHPVTVVLPVVAVKWLCWVDPATGEILSRRKSPAKGTAARLLPEIYRLHEFQNHPNLCFSAVLINVEEYRLADGWNRDGKKGSHRFAREPLEYVDTVTLRSASDFRQFVASFSHGESSVPFTRRDLAKALHLGSGDTARAAQVLERAGILERSGKIKNAIVYTIKPDSIPAAD